MVNTTLIRSLTTCFVLVFILLSCVDLEELNLRGTVDVVVIDGGITSLPEAQVIRLSRSRADPFTGLFGSVPLTKAVVTVVVDSTQVVACHETVDGSYQLPSDFRGQPGHSYQLQFTSSDGTRYQSSQEVMHTVPPINNVYEQFNATSLSPGLRGSELYRGANDFYLDMQDPADQHNYYSWDWILWEKQPWCRSCRGSYIVYALNPATRQYTDQLFEDCYYPDPNYEPPYFDYECRTECWEILYSNSINVFADTYTNGRAIIGQRVAQIPFYQNRPCLVEIRQNSITPAAYAYAKLFQEQTQNTGGLVDSPPSAPVGNVRNLANQREAVVGYFTASAVARVRYWLIRTNNTTRAPGLFQALNARDPVLEPSGLVPYYLPKDAPPRPPTAVCVPGDSRTPFKPEGWQE